MELKALLLAAAFNLSAAGGSLAAEVVLETRPWPEPSACVGCIPIQFGQLEMQLPLSQVGKVLVFDRGNPVVTFAPASGNVLDGVSLIAIPQERLFARYRKLGFFKQHGIKTARQFYDTVGSPAADDKTLALVRKVELSDNVSSYTKSTKGNVSVYRIDIGTDESDVRVYFLVDDDSSIYTLAGPVSQALYAAILSNLRIVKVP